MSESQLAALLEGRVDPQEKLAIEYQFYFRVLQARGARDSNLLLQLRAECEKLPAQTAVPLALILELDFELLSPSPHIDSFQEYLEVFDRFPLWKGEGFLGLARLLEASGKFESAKVFFFRSSQELGRIGAEVRSLWAFYYRILVEGKMRSDTKKLIADYHYVYRKALKLQEHELTALALLGISLEYQKLSAMKLAVKSIRDAVEVSKKRADSLVHARVVFQKYQLLLATDRPEEALKDLEFCRASQFPEIQTLVGGAVVPILASEGQKKSRGRGKGDLSELEVDLLKFLVEGAKDKYQIIEHMYGTRLSLDVTENRLKNLLNRIRKKRPDLIVFEDGKYRIVDPGFLDEWRALAG
jgi:hypothetical protein